MEITTKQRAKLRGMAQTLEVTAQFGKNELSQQQLDMVDQLLTKRELIKCSVLEASPYTARELCEIIAEKTNAVPVASIGKKFVLYRKNKKEPKISLD